MSQIINVVWIIFVVIFFAYYLARLGAALKIPVFVKWRDHLAEKKRIEHQRWSISFDSDTITVVDLRKPKGQPLRLSWSEIDHLTVFKRDLFSYDMICLCLKISQGRGLEFDEHMEGWLPFIDATPIHLPGCKKLEDWIFVVCSETFAANPTEIYRREPQQVG